MRVFLATTGLEECWDTSKSMVFLGPWCERHDREPLPAATRMAGPYEDPKNIDEAYRICRATFETVLPPLARSLQGLHGTTLGERSWRILLGPWLQLFVCAIYDRWLHIQEAQKSYPDFETIGLAASSFTVPRDTLDFVLKAKTDAYNLQLYTEVLEHVGKDFPRKSLPQNQDPRTTALFLAPMWQRWVRRLMMHWPRWFAHPEGVVAMHGTYFPMRIALRLALKSPRRIVPAVLPTMDFSTFTLDSSLRDRVDLSRLNGEFGSLLARLIPRHLPMAYVEGFSTLLKAVKGIPVPRTLFSANAWHYDESFKAWAAIGAPSTRLVGTNHGANYGSLLYVFGEDHELSVVDRYYSWGWSRADSKKPVVPFWSTKMVGRRALSPGPRDILWATTLYSRYLMQFSEIPAQFEEMLAWHLRFLSALGSDLAHVRFRPHREDTGWGIEARARRAFPSLRVERWNVPFEKSLRDSRLYVCDHLSTTFAESLAVNHPTILFWDPAIQRLRPEARPTYEALVKVGVLHFSPEGAAHAATKAYHDIRAWWYQAERQAAVRAFVREFVRHGPESFDAWHKELIHLARMPREDVGADESSRSANV